MTLNFVRAADVQCLTGEGPVYDERTDTLYYVDIPGHRLHALDLPSNRHHTWPFETEVACLGLTVSGRLIVALRHDVVLFDPRTGARELVCTIEGDRAETRLNDGKVGPDGALWVGSMDDRKDKEPIGALYRVSPSGQVDRKVEGVTISNGLAWTADGEWMFHSDTRGPWIDRWRFDRRTGAISERSRFAEPGNDVGRPDGAAVDAEGYYWSAGYSGGRLNRFAPDGTLVQSEPLPVLSPTMPCFGGADFRTLFLTSARENKTAEQLAAAPDTGYLMRAEAPVSGLPAWRFLDA